MTMDCEGCGALANCNNAGLCDYCEMDSEINPPVFDEFDRE